MPPGYLRWRPALPILDSRVLGMGGRAGDLWPRTGLDRGEEASWRWESSLSTSTPMGPWRRSFSWRNRLEQQLQLAMVSPELPEEDGGHQGEQQAGLGDPGLVLGDDGHPVEVQIPPGEVGLGRGMVLAKGRRRIILMNRASSWKVSLTNRFSVWKILGHPDCCRCW